MDLRWQQWRLGYVMPGRGANPRHLRHHSRHLFAGGDAAPTRERGHEQYGGANLDLPKQYGPSQRLLRRGRSGQRRLRRRYRRCKYRHLRGGRADGPERERCRHHRELDLRRRLWRHDCLVQCLRDLHRHRWPVGLTRVQ